MRKYLLEVVSRYFRSTGLLVGLLLVGLLSALSAHADDYLEPKVAFKFFARMVDDKTVEVRYVIADGYYLYRDRFHFRADNATLGEPVFPSGKVKYDENFGKEVEVYRQSMMIRIPVEAVGQFRLIATAQGCADQGLCYPPMDTVVNMSANVIDQTVTGEDNAADISGGLSDMEEIATVLKGGRVLAILPLFFLLGIGLSLTPCVLPMVPILSSIIVGEGAQRGRGLLLSVIYALGMALVYTALGIAAGLAGQGLSAALQHPWVLSVFALLMVGLALSMFDFYQLQVPSVLQSRLNQISEKYIGGKLFGVFVMGAISALIVGPCVAAPLAGALVYISQTRDVILGGGALFAMAVGMSVPLLLIGASAGVLLPRAGAWMESVKRFFGVLMLATALWMIAPVIPVWLEMLGWAILGIGYGVYLLWNRPGRSLAKGVGLVCVVLGVLQLIGLVSGGRDITAPLSHLTGSQGAHTKFVPVRSLAELEAALAQTGGKPALLDFYADWCVACKEMEKFTFSDPRVRDKLSRIVLLQIDVTANNADDKAMLKRFGLFGPPGIILFDHQGQELPGKRVIGYQNADRFLQSLQILHQ